MFFWRLQLILSQTNKGTSFNQPSPSIFICYAFKNCQQKKLKRFVSPGSRFIFTWNQEIVVVLSALLIFSFLAFIKETEKLIISVFMFWVALIFKKSHSCLPNFRVLRNINFFNENIFYFSFPHKLKGSINSKSVTVWYFFFYRQTRIELLNAAANFKCKSLAIINQVISLFPYLWLFSRANNNESFHPCDKKTSFLLILVTPECSN